MFVRRLMAGTAIFALVALAAALGPDTHQGASAASPPSLTGDWAGVYSFDTLENAGDCTWHMVQTGSSLATPNPSDLVQCIPGTAAIAGVDGNLTATISGVTMTGSVTAHDPSNYSNTFTGAFDSGDSLTIAKDGNSGAGTFHIVETGDHGSARFARMAATPTGSNVTVNLQYGASITFTSVIAGGSTQVIQAPTSSGALPSQFELVPAGLYFHVITTATHSGLITLCGPYPDVDNDGYVDGTSPPLPETKLEIWHVENGSYQPRTVSRNTTTNVICGQVTSLSDFAMGVVTSVSQNSIESPDTSGDVGTYTSLALDAAGNPVVSYWDYDADDAKVLHCNDPKCAPGGDTINAVGGTGAYGAVATALALDGSGKPVVAVFDDDAGNAAVAVVHCGDAACSAGNVWTPVYDFPGGPNVLALRLDGSGNPVLAFDNAAGGSGSVKVLHCSNPNCTAGSTVDIGVATPVTSSISLRMNGVNPVVAFDSGGALKVVHCGNASCTSGNVTNTAACSAVSGCRRPSLALDASGNPVVSSLACELTCAYTDLRVTRCSDADCASSSAVPADPATMTGDYSSIALDAAGKPVVSHYDTTNGNLKVVHCGNANCSSGNSVVSPDTVGNVGQYTSLALDASGFPVVSYYDVTNGDLKVLHCGDVNCVGAVPKGGPSGFKIAFSRGFIPSQVYVMNADGSSQTNISNNAFTDAGPAWSPDGTKIAFMSTRSGNPDVWVMNADGSGQTNLTPSPGADDSPAWSPDGTKIAFVSFRDGNYEVYTMNANGSGQANRSMNAALDLKPSWSPDGTKIAFYTDRDLNYQVYVMNAADGSGQANRSMNAAADSNPAWSPDGLQIAFESDRNGNEEVYTMKASDGSAQTNRSNNAAFDGYPAWKTDGTKIAFRSERDGNREVYVMNADGTGQANVTNNADLDNSPNWSRVSGVGADFDFNGCTDAKEAGPSAAAGGLRNPQNFWDFFDVWTAGTRTKVVDVDEIFAIAARVFTVGSPTGNPLAPPTAPGYHVAFDRSDNTAGMDAWDLGPPDGSIIIDEIFFAADQIFHNCT